MQVSKKLFAVTLLMAILISSTVTYMLARNPSSTFMITTGIYPGVPSFMGWREGDYYFVKDANGVIKYIGTDASTVIQSALNDLPDNGVFIVLGTGGVFPLSSPLTIAGYLKTILIYATLICPTGAQALVFGTENKSFEKGYVYVNRIDGTDRGKGKYGIHLKWGCNNRFQINHITNCDIGVYIDAQTLDKGAVADNEWYFNLLDFNGDGIVIRGASYSHHAEGQRFYGGSIFNNTNRGLWIKSYAKHTQFYAVADYNHPDIDDDVGYTIIIAPFVRNIDRTDLDDNAKYNSVIITGGGIAEHGFISQCSGSATFSGDGSKTYFDIEHHLSEPAHSFGVTLASPLSQYITYVEEVTVGSTRYLRVHFNAAPPSGTDNVVLKWWAKIHMGMEG
jgi:hypothetical protein